MEKDKENKEINLESSATPKPDRGRISEMTEIERELMYQEYLSGKSARSIAIKNNVSIISMHNYVNRNHWKERRALLQEEMAVTETIPKEELRRKTAKEAGLFLGKYISEARIMLESGNIHDINMSRIKQAVDSFDKIVRLEEFIENGGKDVKEVNVKKQTLDWNQAIEQSIRAKKEHGEDFNEKEFLSKVIDAEVKK